MTDPQLYRLATGGKVARYLLPIMANEPIEAGGFYEGLSRSGDRLVVLLSAEDFGRLLDRLGREGNTLEACEEALAWCRDLVRSSDEGRLLAEIDGFVAQKRRFAEVLKPKASPAPSKAPDQYAIEAMRQHQNQAARIAGRKLAKAQAPNP